MRVNLHKLMGEECRRYLYFSEYHSPKSFFDWIDYLAGLVLIALFLIVPGSFIFLGITLFLKKVWH